MTVCPTCGEPNPARAAFCLACGSPLPSPSARPARKAVTVVFADVAGSTRLGERLDPGAARARAEEAAAATAAWRAAADA